jgi:hypothetical protein
MRKAGTDPYAVCVWDSPEELQQRREEGVELARRHFSGEEFEKWGRRCINLAQHVSTDRWEHAKKLDKETLMHTIFHMMMLGFPADEPVGKCLK